MNDATSRALRTLAQGALVTAFLAALSVVADLVGSGSTDLKLVGAAAGQAALTAAVSYLHNKIRPVQGP